MGRILLLALFACTAATANAQMFEMRPMPDGSFNFYGQNQRGSVFPMPDGSMRGNVFTNPQPNLPPNMNMFGGSPLPTPQIQQQPRPQPANPFGGPLRGF